MTKGNAAAGALFFASLVAGSGGIVALSLQPHQFEGQPARLRLPCVILEKPHQSLSEPACRRLGLRDCLCGA